MLHLRKIVDLIGHFQHVGIRKEKMDPNEDTEWYVMLTWTASH